MHDYAHGSLHSEKSMRADHPRAFLCAVTRAHHFILKNQHAQIICMTFSAQFRARSTSNMENSACESHAGLFLYHHARKNVSFWKISARRSQCVFLPAQSRAQSASFRKISTCRSHACFFLHYHARNALHSERSARAGHMRASFCTLSSAFCLYKRQFYLQKSPVDGFTSCTGLHKECRG